VIVRVDLSKEDVREYPFEAAKRIAVLFVTHYKLVGGGNVREVLEAWMPTVELLVGRESNDFLQAMTATVHHDQNRGMFHGRADYDAAIRLAHSISLAAPEQIVAHLQSLLEAWHEQEEAEASQIKRPEYIPLSFMPYVAGSIHWRDNAGLDRMANAVGRDMFYSCVRYYREFGGDILMEVAASKGVVETVLNTVWQSMANDFARQQSTEFRTGRVSPHNRDSNSYYLTTIRPVWMKRTSDHFRQRLNDWIHSGYPSVSR
jgi:hypothetical protein